ncbi:hypothetical protein [Shinella sp.]|uniref:hypothetical protein n=1 Tax=Shinella sp. TaxID=1870904 RepID=UPI00301C6719
MNKVLRLTDADGQIKRKKIPAEPTQEQMILFQVSMLRDLHKQAVEVDWFLAYLLEMARAHATDLQNGLKTPQKERRRRQSIYG